MSKRKSKKSTIELIRESLTQQENDPATEVNPALDEFTLSEEDDSEAPFLDKIEIQDLKSHQDEESEDPEQVHQEEEVESISNGSFILETMTEENTESELEEMTTSSTSIEDEFQSDASIEAQLDRLAHVMAAQSEETPATEEPTVSPEVDLEAQIAEAQALEAEEKREQEQSEVIELNLPLDIAEIQSCIEAILFISDKPISLDRLRNLLGPQWERSLFEEALLQLQQRYQAIHHGIELIEVAGGYQFRTKAVRAPLAQKLVRTQTQRLSSGSMETLAIVAYKQPIMKEEIDKVRGVDSSYFIRNLMERKLIHISGRSELPGRPMLYSTTPEFLEIFGLKDLNSMPPLHEVEQMIPGSQAGKSDEEDPKIREMRRLVGEMKSDQSSALYYNPKEDDQLLKEFRERVASIPSSTPYLDELKAAEELAKNPPPAEVAPPPEPVLP